MFTIQQAYTKAFGHEVMVWCKNANGHKVCCFVCKDRFEAVLWIEAAKQKLGY